MKNMKLATKLAFGFGTLLALALGLGLMAVWQMDKVSRDADRLSTENMPMVQASLKARASLHLARYEIRAYGLTGEDRYRLAGVPPMEQTRSHLKEAMDLANQHPDLAVFKGNLTRAGEKMAEYANLVAQTQTQSKEAEAIHARQDAAAVQFVSNSSKYLAGQNQKFEALIEETAMATNLTAKVAELKERLLKVTLANDIIDRGNRLRIANWKSEALRNPALAQAALSEFPFIEQKLRELAPITKQADNKEQLAAVRNAAEEYQASMLAMISNSTTLEGFGVQRNAVSDAAIEAASANSTECMEQVHTMATRTSATLDRASRIMITGLAVAVLLGIAITVYLTLGITRPILKGVTFANELARGNFSQRLDIVQRDEIGILASALNTVVENLQTQIGELREAANVLASSATEISASVTQVTSGAQETATAVTETTATVEEVKQGAHLTSQKSKAVADNAQQGLQMAHAGRKAAETVTEGMTRINEQMTSIAGTIVKLGEQSQAIGEITSTVDDIAEQSNLLAVNAAVEAAKAGEHGKGFAVVAHEIKSLAEQSKQATKQVRGILNDIQKATGAAVMATEKGSKAVDQGMKESIKAGESIQALSASFTESAQSAGQIAASTQEQLTGMDQVATAMENIKEASQQNVTSMKQLEIAAQTLKEIGHKFTESVGRYKV
jgi:methyl-accepting chemotaxis protein